MTLSSRERLRRLYEQFTGNDRVLIAINADPDAISSAMAIKRLLWRKVPEITVAHVNVIKRPDNLVMVRLLGVPLVNMDTIDLRRYNRIVLVDSQPDHHPEFLNLEPAFFRNPSFLNMTTSKPALMPDTMLYSTRSTRMKKSAIMTHTSGLTTEPR